MEQIQFSCTVTNQSSFNDLGIEVWLDDNKFFDNLITTGSHRVVFAFDEDESAHCLKFVMKNKTHNHTVLASDGEIESDAIINISNIMFDDIDIEQIFYENAVYTHDHNGTSESAKHKFYGNLGCNGEVVLNFETPFYLWLLENM